MSSPEAPVLQPTPDAQRGADPNMYAQIGEAMRSADADGFVRGVDGSIGYSEPGDDGEAWPNRVSVTDPETGAETSFTQLPNGTRAVAIKRPGQTVPSVAYFPRGMEDSSADMPRGERGIDNKRRGKRVAEWIAIKGLATLGEVTKK